MRHYVCGRAEGEFEIDGDLAKPVWNLARWSEYFVDIEGDVKPTPRFHTRMKMLWDDRCLYFGAELEEPQIWGTLTQRDSVLFLDNDFEFFLDPDGDNHRYVELEINALNTIWDLLMPKPYRDGGMPMSGWHFKGLRTAVKVFGALNNPSEASEKWTIEVAIPWASIKEICRTECPPKMGDLWKANFSRVEWEVEVVGGKYEKIAARPEANWTWSPQGVVDLHRPEEWGIIQFAERSTDAITEDTSYEARRILHRLYYSQRDFRSASGRWASSLEELGFTETGVEMHATPSLFEAILRNDSGEWHIGSDSHFWRGESYELKCVRGECEYRPDFGAPNVDFK
jgi:hypothetical protein